MLVLNVLRTSASALVVFGLGWPLPLLAQSAPPPEAPVVRAPSSGEVQQPPGRTIYFPGHVSMVIGNSSPVEPSNLLGAMSFEQGVVIWKTHRDAVVPYVGLRVAMDEDGLNWNNKAVAHVWLKYVWSFSHGVVQAGGGYMHDHGCLVSSRPLSQSSLRITGSNGVRGVRHDRAHPGRSRSPEVRGGPSATTHPRKGTT